MALTPNWKKGDKHKCFILGEDTDTFGPGRKMEILSPAQFYPCLLDELDMSKEDVIKEWVKLCKYDASQNKNSFIGNKIVYAYDKVGLLDTRYKGGPTLMETYKKDPQKYWERVCKMDRRKGRDPTIRDAYELNKAITFFKPTTAKYLVQRFCGLGTPDNRKIVFDPCAGWSGRLLGTLSAGHIYQGCDTNPDIRPRTFTLISHLLEGPNGLSHMAPLSADTEVITKSCLEPPVPEQLESADFSFTSPPYNNLEVYKGMKIFVDDEDYYKNFLIPMIKMMLRMVKPACWVAVNVSPKIYEQLTDVYEFPVCSDRINFLQQMGQQSGKKKDYVYCWQKTA
jgi:hypothetical protein